MKYVKKQKIKWKGGSKKLLKLYYEVEQLVATAKSGHWAGGGERAG